MYALHLRHLLETPDAQAEALRYGTRKMWRKLAIYNTTIARTTPENVIAHKTGKLKRRYELAFLALRTKGWQRRYGNVSMFLKHDKDLEWTITDKVPRCVQHRHPCYTAKLATWLYPIEQYIFRGSRLQRKIETAVFAKSHDSFMKAQRLLAMRRWADDTLFIELDHSRWDAHMSIKMLQKEHLTYLKLASNDPELRELLDMQIINRARSHNGTRYISAGKRMSGDLNTGLGNSIMNYVVLLWATRKIPSDAYEIYLDGDDSVIAMNRHYRHLLDTDFAKIGMTTKIEQEQTLLQRVGFCQSKPIRTGAGIRMVREPVRAITRMMFSPQKYNDSGWYRYMRGVAECERNCNRGVPIMQVLADTLLKQLPTTKALDADVMPEDYLLRMKLERDPGPVEVTNDARFDFYLAFGLSADEQRYYERVISNTDFRPQLEFLAGRREGVHHFPGYRGAGTNPYA
nr:MAG: nonstructural protein [Riboviria sp.]